MHHRIPVTTPMLHAYVDGAFRHAVLAAHVFERCIYKICTVSIVCVPCWQRQDWG